MEKLFLPCASLTHAQKGRQALAKCGYSCRIVRGGTGGCCYGILLLARDRSSAEKILAENGVQLIL